MRMLSSLIKADISNILMVSSYFSVLHVIVQLTLVKLDMIQLSFIPEIIHLKKQWNSLIGI